MAESPFERIAVVTRHYGALRGGVTRAIWAPFILSGALVDHFDLVSRGVVFGVPNSVVVVMSGMALWLHSRRWLDNRFGRVLTGRGSTQVLQVLACWFGYLAAGRLDAIQGPGAGLPSAIFLFLGMSALWCCVRLRPYSLHYLLPTGSAVLFAIQFAALSDWTAFTRWEISAYTVTALAWLVAGLIDLVLLMKFLPRRKEDNPLAAHA